MALAGIPGNGSSKTYSTTCFFFALMPQYALGGAAADYNFTALGANALALPAHTNGSSFGCHPLIAPLWRWPLRARVIAGCVTQVISLRMAEPKMPPSHVML